jgi:MIP family channel proteins
MFAEVVGTFALMFVSGAAIIISEGDDLTLIALATGLVLAVMVSATLHISGAQFNPAVSLALFVAGRQSRGRTITFILAQIGGAVLAALALKYLFQGAYADEITRVKLGATLGAYTSGDDPSLLRPGQACALEMIAAFLLMFVIMGTAVDQRGIGKSAAVGGFGIGLVVAADILAIGPLTGASMNPARSLAPALIAGGDAWSCHWVYWFGPILGTVTAALTYQAVFGPLDRAADAS